MKPAPLESPSLILKWNLQLLESHRRAESSALSPFATTHPPLIMIFPNGSLTRRRVVQFSADIRVWWEAVGPSSGIDAAVLGKKKITPRFPGGLTDEFSLGEKKSKRKKQSKTRRKKTSFAFLYVCINIPFIHVLSFIFSLACHKGAI